jgi:hypothetical protein
MMALLFSNSSNLIRENQSVFEIRKRERACNVMIVDDLPMWNFSQKPIQLHPLQGWSAASTGNTMF